MHDIIIDISTTNEVIIAIWHLEVRVAVSPSLFLLTNPNKSETRMIVKVRVAVRDDLAEVEKLYAEFNQVT